MITLKLETKEVQVIDKILCNYCGQEIKDIGYGRDFAKMNASWGYGSLHDTENFELHICESCVYTHIMPVLKIQPDIIEMI